MDNICKICGEIVLEKKHFYKNHKISESNYYIKYHPKFDLLSKEPIPFKSVEQYFNTDFIDKNHLKKYLESVTKEQGLHYLSEWLFKRKITKNIEYSPSQFELRTLCYPSIKFFNKFYGLNSYETICNYLQLKNRFNYNQLLEYEAKEPKILIDTREQSILKFNNEKEIVKLDVGDYSSDINKYNVIIERKSIQDFLGSVSAGFDRFSKEMERAKQSNTYVIILIESKISNLFGFKHLGYLHTEASVDYILHRARELLLKFQNIQICCVDGRMKASEFIINLYKLKNDPRTVDWQYMVDCGMI